MPKPIIFKRSLSKSYYAKLSTNELKELVNSSDPEEAQLANELLAKRIAKRERELALIPQIVKDYCKGLWLTYEGKYHEYKVFSVSFHSDDDPEDLVYCMGMPAFVLWDPKKPDSIRQVSDVDLKITCYLDQKEMERKEKRRARRKAKLAAANASAPKTED